MPITNYSVLQGLPTAGKVVTGSSTHYQITMQATGGPFTVAVNTESTDGSEVLYYVNNNFTPPDVQALQALTSSVTPLDRNSNLALDYVRTPGLVTREQMILLPIDETSPSSPLHSMIDTLIQKAIQQSATIYAFGQSFSGAGVNPFFHFQPDQG